MPRLPIRCTLTEIEFRACRSGDERCFAELYGRYTPYLLAYAHTLLRVREDAEDAVQESWLRAYDARGRFENVGSFAGWLSHICRNICVSSLRARRQEAVSLDCVDDPCVLHAEHGVKGEPVHRGRRTQWLCDWVDDQFVALPRLQRDVAAMRWLFGHSTEQTAHEIGIAPGTVKAALHQARKKVRSRLLTQEARTPEKYEE